MSIQSAREAIAKNQGALLKADGTFFRTVENRYQAIKDKGTAHPADLRRLQSDVGSWVNQLVNKPDWNSSNDQGPYDGAMGWNALLGAEIDLLLVAGTMTGAPKARSGGWINAETGTPVEVFASTEKLASNERNEGPSVGQHLEAILSGAKTPEIKASLSEGVDSAGGYSIPTTVLREFIDKMRSKTRFVEAGARTVLLEGLNTRIMRIDSDPTPAWRAENATVAEGEPTFGAVNLVPRSMACLVKVSEELLADSVNVAQALETALAGALAVELDRAALFGNGTANQPLGLYNTPGINTVSMGVNGDAPADYDDLLDALYEIEAANGDGATAAIMHPRTARTYRKLKDTTNQPLLMPEALRAVKMLGTTSVPIDQTQGTGTALSTILVGDYRQAILGIRQSLVIRRLSETFAGNLQVGFLAYLRADIAVEQPKVFTRVTGVKV